MSSHVPFAINEFEKGHGTLTSEVGEEVGWGSFTEEFSCQPKKWSLFLPLEIWLSDVTP